MPHRKFDRERFDMKNRSPSFPKKVIESNRERWVVYYFDTEKQKRWARRFSTEAEALEFFREKNIYDEKLGVEADRISPNDRRELVEAKMLLSPLAGVAYKRRPHLREAYE